MKKILLTTSAYLGAGYIAFAQSININLGGANNSASGANSAGGQTIMNVINLAQTIVAKLGILFPGLALLGLFYFIVMFIWKGNNDATKRHEYLLGMGYSILALFVMVSIWGLVQFLGSFFGIGAGGSAPIPGIPVPTQ